MLEDLDVYTSHFDESSQDKQDIRGTFELGDNGYTACLSSDFDLLQLTAPNPDGCGLVFARGNFPDEPQSILARAQRPGFGFGMRIPEKVQYRWNESLQSKERRDRKLSGYLNYRWPVLMETLKDATGSTIAETLTAWYIKDGTLFQVTKISARSSRKQEIVEVPYRLGDRMRFGCCCTGCPTSTDMRFHKSYRHTASLSHGKTLLMAEDKDLKTRTYMQWFIDAEPQEIELKNAKTDFGSVHVGSNGVIKLRSEPVIVVHMMSLRCSAEKYEVFQRAPPSMDEVEAELGITAGSACWGKIWRSDLGSTEVQGNLFPTECSNLETHQLKLDIIARTVEYLISVASVPQRGNRPPIALLSNIVATLTVDIHTLL